MSIRFSHDASGVLMVTVEDDGVGMRDRTSSGLGLIGIKERVRELGGEFVVESLPDKGTRVAVHLPEEAVAHG